MTDALVTSSGRSGDPPGSAAASLSLARASFTAFRSASLRSVRARFVIPEDL
jgi:hypothetical protein